ncbi:hypothetical protein P606_11860 [Comamonas thiooxydans]|nr:hypothetical protein P606_11860 [Comamonas thiooxydans]
MECSVNTDEVNTKRNERSFSPKAPPKPLYLVEQEAAEFRKKQIFVEKIWNAREGRAFSFFVDYLRMLRVNEYERIDPDFFNALRMNVIQTYFEGAISKQNLYAFCYGVDAFIDSKIDSGLTPLFYDEEIYDIIMERQKFARFDADSFQDTLEELRQSGRHTEAALLEVVRYLGLTLKEAMYINPSLSLDYARSKGHIVIRNQDAQYSRRIPVWNEDQATALIRLATNRLMADPEEGYRHKKYAYIFAPVSPVYKALSNNNLSLYSLRFAYFEDEFYRNAFIDFNNEEISHHAHLISHQMGHAFCFDDSFLFRQTLDERKVVTAHALLERHPAKLLLPEPIQEYITAYRNRPNEE